MDKKKIASFKSNFFLDYDILINKHSIDTNLNKKYSSFFNFSCHKLSYYPTMYQLSSMADVSF